MTPSTSYPILSIARHYGLSYGALLLATDAWLKAARRGARTPLNYWEKWGVDEVVRALGDQDGKLVEVYTLVARLPIFYAAWGRE